ncbi:MAG: hypothetical protein HQK68_10640 [Desulfamplus sp.]|nr:hypothetical protein [Desulfamplus sp.]
MNNPEITKNRSKYTCSDYREEMILASLRQQLANPDLSQEAKESLIKEIEKIEKEMGL